MMRSPFLRAVALVLGLLALALTVAWGLWAFVPEARLALILGNVLLAFGAFVHAAWLLGWRKAMAFFALAVSLTFILEALSLATGLATPYHYSAILGPRFLGVPLVVPLGWFSMLYASHVTVNLMVEGSPAGTGRRHGRMLWMALLTALAMTAWDLTLDPYMVRVLGAWVWEQPSGFVQIPFANYVSWLELTFIIALCFRVVEHGQPSVAAPRGPRFVLALPALIYALIGLSGCLLRLPDGLNVLPPFAMAIAALAALGRLMQMQRS